MSSNNSCMTRLRTLYLITFAENIQKLTQSCSMSKFELGDIPQGFHMAAAGRLWKMMLAKIRGHGGIKNEDNGRSQTPKPAPAERGRSSSILQSRSTASLREQMGLVTVKEKMSLNDVNVHIRNPVNHTTVKTFPLRRCLEAACLQKVEEEGLVMKGLSYLM
jgi:hypothetical protein